MEPMVFLAEAFLFLLKVIGGIAGIVFVSYLGVLIYDELTGRSNELYEHSLTLAVGAEFLLNGKPRKPEVIGDQGEVIKYHGRHRQEDPFISDLVVERREDPKSLCYNKKMTFEEDCMEPVKGELCGVF